MSEDARFLIEAAAHNCEAALLRGDTEVAELASRFAFLIAQVGQP